MSPGRSAGSKLISFYEAVPTVPGYFIRAGIRRIISFLDVGKCGLVCVVERMDS